MLARHRMRVGWLESLFDQALPVEVRELPEDLTALDRLLRDPVLLEPVERAWDRTARRQALARRHH